MNTGITMYSVFNGTDGIYASHEPFATQDEARAFIAKFRKRFEFQGYYLTSDGLRIQPRDIELVIEPGDFGY